MEIQSIVKQDFILLDEEATVSELIGKLKQFEKRSALIFKKNKFSGIIEKKSLLKTRLETTTTKVKHYIQKTPLLSENADVLEAATMMFKSNLAYVPVEKNKQISGILESLDVAALAVKMPETKHLKVSDIKLVKTRPLSKGDSIAKAIESMYKNKIDHVPVFDQGKLHGIVTYKDLLRNYLNWSPKRNNSAKFNKLTSSRSSYSDIHKMSILPIDNFTTSQNLRTINARENLKSALKVMTENNLSDLIVMDSGEFKGLLTVKNILGKVGRLKIIKHFNVKFIGLNDVRLSPQQKYNLKKITDHEAMKLQRKIKQEFTLVLHLKEYTKEGDQGKFSVHLRIEYPGKILTSEQFDWDLETALRKTFNNAKNNTNSRFKEESNRKREFIV